MTPTLLAPEPLHERASAGSDVLPTDARRLQVLYRVASELVANLRLHELLPRVLDALADLFRYDRCAIVLKEDDGTLFPVATRPEGLGAPFSRTVADRVTEKAEALLFDDIQGQAGFDLGESVIGLNIRSVLCAPLTARGQVAGLVYLDRSSAGAYGAEDLALLRGVTAMVAVALENALLYEELEGRYEQTAERLRAAEARLVETERAAALGQLASTVADAVRNPVTVIGGLVRHLFRAGGGAGEPEVAAAVQEEVGRLESAMSQVDALVSLPDPSLCQSEVLGAVGPVLEELAGALAERGIVVTVQQGDGPEQALHDPVLTRIAVKALFEYACRSLPRGTRLCVSGSRLGAAPALRIADERCADVPMELRGVFEAGAAAEPWALDLGLALAERAMVAQGGDVRLGGRVDTGACAYLLLPQ